MKVSVGANKDIMCVMIMDNGRVVHDARLRTPVVYNKFDAILHGLSFAANVIREYLLRVGLRGVDIEIEITGQVVSGWFRERKCPAGYARLFYEILEELDRLSIRYEVVGVGKALAARSLGDGYIENMDEYAGYTVEPDFMDDLQGKGEENWKAILNLGGSDLDVDDYGSDVSLIQYLGLEE